jgi:hypothetical protein
LHHRTWACVFPRPSFSTLTTRTCRGLSHPSFTFTTICTRSSRSSCVLIPPATSSPWPTLALQRPFGRTIMPEVSCAARLLKLTLLTANRTRSAVWKAAAGRAGEPADPHRSPSARRRRRSIWEHFVEHHASDRAHKRRLLQGRGRERAQGVLRCAAIHE